ncbi:Hsp70 family protein [Actinoallomurus rhizosphaericola]|uniref:Hsp70 family protein n=1 Tax=Actinoallomurus rhizosphaericola TaxID=2952536 RepID=UPI0020900723|nr:Hsp70 family protein [Actinoallomurus rhizosphaericola]MCO5993278.1 Hsp70 family protein [Actinoallomurus rhizosphaericola]
MAVYGIDLGTTHSCIARVDDVGRPAVLRNMEGTDTTPSVVYFESADNVVVGAPAKDTAVLFPDLVVSLIKRDMGHEVPRELHERDYSPEEISAFVLRKLVADATATTGEEVRDVVITVPAYFGAAERDATRKAGRIAGLNVIDIISEPIAAAITYGVLNPATAADEEKDGAGSADRTILVYDLGGGTFDTTVITLRGGDISVVCTDGDHELGGADWDARLVEYLAGRFAQEHPDVGDPLDDKHTEQQLRHDAEEAKKALSLRTRHVVRVMHEGRVATVELTREKFEEITKDLLDRTIEITGRTLATAAGKGVSDYDDLVLVGGSTKMPAVQRRLADELALSPRLQDPDLAVAKGAALYAFEETYRQLLAKGETDKALDLATRAGLSESEQERMAARQITTVASRAFGVIALDPDTEQEHVVHLVHANDALPRGKTREFGTIEEDQTIVKIIVVEQAGSAESTEVAHNTPIADGELKIPPGKPAGWPIEVTFALDTSGLLHVTAVEKETAEELTLEVRVGGMSEEEVHQSRTDLAGIRVD